MGKRASFRLAFVSFAALLLLAMASNRTTLYLPLVSRMPPPAPSLSGRVFFDYNGSGQQEQGEPGIAGVPVWIDSIGSALHATTGADGSYSIPNVPPGAHQVYVQSPTQDPATAFRYINLFKGWVDIPAYAMNGIQVPAQHLLDTEIRSIDQPLDVMVTGNARLDVALMQGFLTLPFVKEQFAEPPLLHGYFDIIGRRLFLHDGSFTYQDSLDGKALNYDGRITWEGDGFRGISGVGDSHSGLDYYVPLGRFTLSGLPTSQVWYIDTPPGRPDYPVETWFEDPVHEGEYYSSGAAHLHAQLVQMDQKVYRGQIIGLAGNEGHGPQGAPVFPGSIHFGLVKFTAAGWWYFDPYRYTVQLNPLPTNFWGSEASWWTKDNDPQFPLSGVALPAPTPIHTPIPSTRIVIDGLANDWAGVAPVLEDAQGDSLGGLDMDLIAAYVAQDDTDVCLMIRTAQNWNPQRTMLELMLDLQPGEGCGHRWELRSEVRADNTFSASLEDPCGTWNPVTIPGYMVAWRDVLEIRIPRSALGLNEFVRPTHTLLHIPGYQFWVDNMP